MLQYVLTALTGLACGIVLMRILQVRSSAPTDAEPAEAGPGGKPAPGILWPRGAFAGAAIIVALAAAIFVFRRGDVDPVPARPGPAANAAPASGLADVDTMIRGLEDRLKTNPNDGEGFRMLGWSYVNTARPEKAIGPYRRAIELLPENGDAQAGLGEALVAIGGGTVSQEAKAAFERAMALDSRQPRARYFLALYKSQNGSDSAALDDLIQLSNDEPSDAPWQAEVRQRIAALADKLGVDVAGRLKAPAAAITIPTLPAPDPAAVQQTMALPAQERQAMINNMVDGLSARLKSEPNDLDGWLMLLRSRMVLKQLSEATADLRTARATFALDAAKLDQLNAAAKSLGVPGS